MHHDLVDLRVVGPGDLPGQERLRDRRPGRRPGPRTSGPPGQRRRAGPRPMRPPRPRRGRVRGGGRFRGNAGGRPGRLARRSAQAARSALSSTAPASGGSRNVPDSEPSSSNRQARRRRTRASASPAAVTWRWARANRSSWFAVIGPASSARPASVAGVAIRVSARTLAYDSAPGGELGPDHRQVPQRPRYPDMLPRGAGGQLALPRQPLRAGAHLPAGPAPPGIEIAQQDQEPARRRGQVPGQLADLRLQPLQRHAGRPGRRTRPRRPAARRQAETKPGPLISNMYSRLARGSDKTARRIVGDYAGDRVEAAQPAVRARARG